MTKSSLRADVGPSEITVLEFFDALQATETEAPFDDLRYLVEDEGLQLRTGYKGTIGDIPAYDVTVAIIKASRAQNIKEEKAMAEAKVDGKWVQYPLHGLYVKRSEVADIYKNLGESNYPWVGNGRDVGDKSVQANKQVSAKGDSLSVFREMGNLSFTEVTIEFVPGGVLEVSARKIKKTVSYTEIGIFNRKQKKLNRLGECLLRLSKGRSIRDENKKTISDVRGILRGAMGIVKEDPFQTDSERTPHFTIRNVSNRADRRARKRAISVPHNDNINYDVDKYASVDDGMGESVNIDENGDEYPYEDENDAAAELLRNISEK